MAEGGQPKWEGKATSNPISSTPQQVWALLEDFCSLNNYLPSIHTCYKLDGEYGQPGLIRYCSPTVPSSSFDGEKIVKWCHEKLLAIDPLKRYLTYEVLENNIGFGSYFGTIKVLSIDGGDENEQGCVIEWSFVADPIQGWTMQGLLTYIDSSVQTMAGNIGKISSLWSDMGDYST